MLGSVIIVAAENKRSGLGFMDAMFMSFSAACSTGLATVDLAQWSPFTQVVFLIVGQLGSIVVMTLPIVIVRRYHLRRAYRGEHADARENNQSKNSAVLTTTTSSHLMVHENLEYKSLGKLLMIIPLYWFLVQFIGFIIIGAYLSNTSSRAFAIVQENNSTPWFWGFFCAQTAFNNIGITPFSANLAPFHQDRLILLIMSLLIMSGNTLYPVFLRWFLWLCSKIARDKAPYTNLLANPRIYFTHLFPAKQTWILCLSWAIITALQMIFFLWFDSDNTAIAHLETDDLFLDAFFQSVSIRSAGFNILAVDALSNALLVLYLIMMYMSVYPFVVSLRETAVNSKYQQGELAASRRKRTQAVFKDLIARDILLLYIATLVISMIEDTEFPSHPSLTVFRIMFEVVSAYGTCGLSMGYPSLPYSFSGVLKTPSKLIILLVMLFGRHRGLPESVDTVVNTKEFAPLERLIMKDEDYDDEDIEIVEQKNVNYPDNVKDIISGGEA